MDDFMNLKDDLISRSKLLMHLNDYALQEAPFIEGQSKEAYNAIQNCMKAVKDAPAVEAVAVVRCKDCIWWEDEHVLLPDGTRRPYTKEEKENYPMGVPCDIGINVGSKCMENPRITTLYRNANDYCSRARERRCKNDSF